MDKIALIVMVSGGSDSIALLYACKLWMLAHYKSNVSSDASAFIEQNQEIFNEFKLFAQKDLAFKVIHVNHMLRGDDANKD
ncbi:MAG: hypothetical protein MJ189_03290, partial [Coriobacteriales bacterium]|nr:hypothetical protein [Coriobacteriales bacterium]